jgi:hypothetical protein
LGFARVTTSSWANASSTIRAPFIPLVLTKRKKEIDYEAKAGRHPAALERQLKKGDKSLVGNKDYRRFLATPGDDHCAIDWAKAEEDAKFDGVFVLKTNADLSPLEAIALLQATMAGGTGVPHL